MMIDHLSMDEIEEAFDLDDSSPRFRGTLEMIVYRPEDDERKEVDSALLDPVNGLVGDNWLERGSRRTDDGSAHPDMQIAIMNSRVIGLVARERSQWPLAGDQLFVDLDLSEDNISPGEKISVGSAVLEITEMPHNACGKFTARFGSDATRFLNSKEGRQLRRRGVYARVIQGGTIAVSDLVSKLPSVDK